METVQIGAVCFTDDEWKCGINMASKYIFRNAGKELTLESILRNIYDERFLQLDEVFIQKFLMGLGEKIAFSIEGNISTADKCIIKYNPKRIIWECVKALERGDTDAMIVESLVKERSELPCVAEATVNLAREFQKLARLKRCHGLLKIYTAKKKGRRAKIETIEKKLKQDGFTEEEIIKTLENFQKNN